MKKKILIIVTIAVVGLVFPYAAFTQETVIEGEGVTEGTAYSQRGVQRNCAGGDHVHFHLRALVPQAHD